MGERMNTRVSITTNGPIHLGHAYVILLNEQVAHKSGGSFHVRFDDSQPYWIQKIGLDGQRCVSESIRGDLEWLGIPVDGYTSEHDNAWRVAECVDELLRTNDHEFDRMVGTVEHDYLQAIYRSVAEPDKSLYPYAPWLTVEKVVWDFLQSITHVIRGDELMTEASFYAFVCKWFGWPVPEQIFIPRLLTHDGNDLADVSKTRGNWKLADIRAQGWTPERVRSVLAVSCLKDPQAGWTVDNVRRAPVLTL